MKMRCPNCKADTNFNSRGGWLNYSNGIGSPDEKCPKCRKPMPTGRRFWNELTFSDQILIYSKAIIWIPVGMIFFMYMGYLYSRYSSSTNEVIMTHEESMQFFTDNYIAVLLFAFVASLTANVTTVKLVIKSNTVRTRGWV